MRIFLTIALLATVLVAVPASRADACSCALLSTSEMLEAHEAAFVGTLIERGDPVRQDANFGQMVTFTFEVEQWLKGDLGETIEVQSASDGAACGFEIPVGERAAIFLTQQRGVWSSGLCSTMNADVALAGMEPLVTGSTDPPFAVLYGGTGAERLLLIDAQGDIISLLPDEGSDSWINTVSVCPGGERIVEVGDTTVRVRALPDLKVEREFDPDGDFLNRAWCRSEDASQILSLVSVALPESELSRLVDQDGRVFFEGRAWVAEVVGDTVYVAVNGGKTLVGIDLETGDSRVAYEVEVEGAGIGGVESLASNGTELAFVSTVYQGDVGRSELVVIDANGEIVGRRELDDAADARWIGPDRLRVSTYDEVGQHLAFDATTLEPIGSIVPGYGASAAAGDLGVGLDQGTLVAFEGTDVRPIRTYPNAALWNLAVIDPTVPPDIPTDAPILKPDPVSEPAPGTTLPPEARPEPIPDNDDGIPMPFVIAIVAGLLTTAGMVVIRRNRTL